MKTISTTIALFILFIFTSCANEFSETKMYSENEMAFMRGEKPIQNKNSYIINGKMHHPFLFSDQLNVIKDKTKSIKDKSELVFQTLKDHIKTNGISESNQFDIQKLILYLYGDYALIDETLKGIQKEHHEFYLNALIDFKAIDFKYLAKISKFVNSNDTYVMPKSKEYLEKYKKILKEQDLDESSRYGSHCHNIVDSCTKAIKILQTS